MLCPVLNLPEFMLTFYNYCIGSTEYKCRPALISSVCLGVALFISLTGLIIVIVLLIKSKTKDGTVVVNTTADKVQSRNTSLSRSSRINTKKNISYVVHSPKTESVVNIK